MEAKEANQAKFLKKQSHNLKFQQKLQAFSRTRDNSPRSPRSLIKSFNDLKPKRSFSGGGVPRHRMKVGNSSKNVGCNYCFQSLNHMINKRAQKQADIKYNIQNGEKFMD
jgi:hypothetical protein